MLLFSHGHVRHFATLWTIVGQASLSFTISRSLLNLMSIELVMPSNHLILCHPLRLPSIFPSIRVFSSESVLHISSVQSLSLVQLFATPWTAAHQASLSITSSRNLLKLMSIKSVISSNSLILCHPLLLLPSVFPSIRVFFNVPFLHIRWPKYWSFSFNISPSNEYSRPISFRID